MDSGVEMKASDRDGGGLMSEKEGVQKEDIQYGRVRGLRMYQA